MELHGAPNELSLVLQRGAAHFQDSPITENEWSDKWICKNHLEDLARHWVKRSHQTRKGNDVMCAIDGKRKAETSMDYNIARHVLTTQGIHYHAGAGSNSIVPERIFFSDICYNHRTAFRNEMQNLPPRSPEVDILPAPAEVDILPATAEVDLLPADPIVSTTEPSPLVPLINPDSPETITTSSSPPPCQSSLPQTPSRSSPVVDKDLSDALENLLRIANIGRLAKPRKSWDEYKENTKEKKVYSFRQLRSLLLTLIAPDAEEEFLDMISNMESRRNQMDLKFESSFKTLMMQVQSQFMLAQSRRQKRLTLSLVAGVFPYGVVSHYIPGISPGLYRKARILSMNKFYEEPVATVVLERYEPLKVDSFVTFLTRFVRLS